MQLKQLEYFMAAADAKSISLAAKKLFMAQPPISRQISLLEEELKVNLFVRNNKGISLTPAGISLYNQTKELFQGINKIIASVKDQSKIVSGSIKIGLVRSNSLLVSKNIKKFLDRFPGVTINVKTDAPQNLIKELENGNLNLIFIRNTYFKYPNFSFYEFAESPTEIILNKSIDPCPDKKEINISDLDNLPMCILKSDDPFSYSEELLNECEKNNVHPKIVSECYDASSIVTLVKAGIAFAYQPKDILEDEATKNVYSKPINGLTKSSKSMILWSEEAYLSNAAKNFLEMFGYKPNKYKSSSNNKFE